MFKSYMSIISMCILFCREIVVTWHGQYFHPPLQINDTKHTNNCIYFYFSIWLIVIRTYVTAVLIEIILRIKQFQWSNVKITHVRTFKPMGSLNYTHFHTRSYTFCSMEIYSTIACPINVCEPYVMSLVYIHNIMFLHDFCMCPVSYALL